MHSMGSRSWKSAISLAVFPRHQPEAASFLASACVIFSLAPFGPTGSPALMGWAALGLLLFAESGHGAQETTVTCADQRRVRRRGQNVHRAQLHPTEVPIRR